MGETPADTLKEIEATRARLDGELRQLERQLPATVSWLKRAGAVLAGIGAIGVTTRFVLRGRRKARRDRRMHDLEKRLDRVERRLDD